MTLGLPDLGVFGLERSATPSNGAKRTATNQETISAILTTAKIENVYSPAELLAKPIGTKAAAVTNDPVNIGNASVHMRRSRPAPYCPLARGAKS